MANFYFRRKSFTSVFSLLLIFFSSLSYPTMGWAMDRHRGILVLSSTSDPKSFNDILAQETSSTMVTSNIFEGLTMVNAQTLQVEPLLAQSWDVQDDGKTWIFHLRDDVKFNDGHPFTADDVVFTFNQLIYNEKIPSSARDIFSIQGKVFDVKKIDDHTVRFQLPVRFAPFLRSMTQPILPKHKLQSAVDDGKFNFTWGIDTAPQEIVGTGAFRLTEYSPGERLVFERNPYYWKKSKEGESLPYLDKIIYVIVQNQDVAILKFLEGDLDFVGVRGSDYPLLKPVEEQKNFRIYETGPDFGSNFIVFNQNSSINPKTAKPFVDPVKLRWFSNVQFRKAVAHSIDRQKIIEILNNGLGYPQFGPLSPSIGFFYNPRVEEYAYDLKRAKDILNQAGLQDRDGDGTIEDPEGNKIEFNLFTNSGSQERVQIAAIVRYDLQKLGMKVNFLAIEFNSLVGKLTSSFDWDAVILGLTGGGVDPHFGKNVWHSSGQLHMWYPHQEAPATNWETRVDEIFNLGVQELDDNKRKILYDEYQKIVADQLPLIYTVLDSNMFAIRNKFGNLRPTSYGGAFHNIEEIYLK